MILFQNSLTTNYEAYIDTVRMCDLDNNDLLIFKELRRMCIKETLCIHIYQIMKILNSIQQIKNVKFMEGFDN